MALLRAGEREGQSSVRLSIVNRASRNPHLYHSFFFTAQEMVPYAAVAVSISILTTSLWRFGDLDAPTAKGRRKYGS